MSIKEQMMKRTIRSTIAISLALAGSSFATAATYVAPGGALSLSGPVTYQVSVSGNPSQDYSYTCDTTINAAFYTENLSQVFYIQPQTLAVDDSCKDGINGPVIDSTDSSWNGNFFNSGTTVYSNMTVGNLVIKKKSGGFGPRPPYAVCQGALNGLTWSGSNVSTGAAATKILIPTTSLSGTLGSFSATCIVSGTLYVSPFQSFTN